MTEALEELQAERKHDPVFTRGAELEITTKQDLELIKNHLAQLKIHVPTKKLELAIVMPRDFEGTGKREYPQPRDFAMFNPYKKPKNVAAKKKKKDKGDKDKDKSKKLLKVGLNDDRLEFIAMNNGKLFPN